VQHWLKVQHSFTGGDVGDPHRLGADGEPLMRPAYEAGDLALIYIAGSYRCPAVVELTAPASFDANRSRWGWRTPVRVLAEAPLERSPWLEDIGVPRISVGRQSRLRLRPEQFEAGARVLSRASPSSPIRRRARGRAR
jgi:hypothetical protein